MPTMDELQGEIKKLFRAYYSLSMSLICEKTGISMSFSNIVREAIHRINKEGEMLILYDSASGRYFTQRDNAKEPEEAPYSSFLND